MTEVAVVLGQLALRAKPDLPGLLVPLDHPMDPQALQALRVRPALQVALLVLKDTWALLVQWVQPVHKVSREQRVEMVNRVQLVRPEKVLLVLRVQLAQLDLQVIALLDPPDHRDRKERMEILEVQAPPALKENRVESVQPDLAAEASRGRASIFLMVRTEVA